MTPEVIFSDRPVAEQPEGQRFVHPEILAVMGSAVISEQTRRLLIDHSEGYPGRFLGYAD